MIGRHRFPTSHTPLGLRAVRAHCANESRSARARALHLAARSRESPACVLLCTSLKPTDSSGSSLRTQMLLLSTHLFCVDSCSQAAASMRSRAREASDTFETSSGSLRAPPICVRAPCCRCCARTPHPRHCASCGPAISTDRSCSPCAGRCCRCCGRREATVACILAQLGAMGVRESRGGLVEVCWPLFVVCASDATFYHKRLRV